MTKTNYCRTKFLKLGTILSISTFYPLIAGAVDVSSWAELKAARNDANIVFADDIQAEGEQYPMPISFNSTTEQIIDGSGHSIVGASGYSFSLNDGDVIFKNLGKYSEGSAEQSTFSYKDLNDETQYVKVDTSVNSFQGYFITNNNPITLDIENSVFTDNNARLLVLNAGQTINIKDSILYNNTSSNDAMIGYGKANINIENSIFYNNSNLTSQGGVVCDNGTITVKNSYFINNHADDDWDGFGGVIQLSTGSFNSTIEGAKFENNTAYYDGGAIALEGGMSGVSGVYIKYIKNSEFINNRAWHEGDEYGYDGGAIATDGGFIETVDNVVFDGNKAGWHGGGLWLGMSEAYDDYGYIHIKNSTFTNNEAGLGGGMYIEYGDTTGNQKAYITDTDFTSNTVTNVKHYTSSNFGPNSRPGGYPAGGALVIGTTSRQGLPFSLPATLNNVTFSANTAIPHTTKNYSAGGAVYFLGLKADNSLKIIDSTFSNNSAFEGGALFVDNADTAIIAQTKDVVFSSNTAVADADDYNGGADIYFQANEYSSVLSLNAAENKKIVFNGSIASYTEDESTSTIDINKSGITYNTYDGTTETSNNAGTAGEIQFNNRIGDETYYFTNINLYGGKLSIGQNDELNEGFDNPDGLINNNNFTVAGSSTLNTANGIIGEFAPATFNVNAALSYQFDIDLENTESDKLVGATVNDGGSINLSVLNIISDTDASDLKIIYSDTNIGGVLQDDYQITTSEASYDVSAGNDDTGSYLLISKASELGGLPYAVKNGSDAYSITSDEDEVVEAWDGNSLIADLAINGNGHAITTSNALDGINVGSSRTLTMNDVSGMSGFNYAFSNSGTVNMTDTTINDDIINNGTMEINQNVSLGNVSGSGKMNINADHELAATVAGNEVNVNNAKLSGVENLASNVALNAVSGEIALDNKTANVKSANFGANSTLSLSINSLTDYGKLIAESINVESGAKLQATLAQGLVKVGEKAELQLLSANNSDFNNFSDSFDNNMYHFEKVDNNGKYKIYMTKSAEDVVEDAGGQRWVAAAAKAYVDGDEFDSGSVAAGIADKLAAFAQTDANKLIKEIKALAPTETAFVQDQAIAKTDILFKTTESYLRGDKETIGVSHKDVFSGVKLWARPYMTKTKINNSKKVVGYEAENIGIITGLDKKINADFKLGAGLQYEEADIDALRREVDASTKVGFVYAEYKPGIWFVNAIAAYGVSDYDEDKFALGSKYNANYDVKTTSLAATLGYQFDNFIPEVSLRYYNIKRDGYTDAAEQDVKASHADYLRATAGVRFSKEYGMFSPDVYLGLGYDIVSAKNNTCVMLANGTGYSVEGKRLSRLEYEFNAGLNARLSDKVTLGIAYMGAYREDYQEHTGMLRFNYAF